MASLSTQDRLVALTRLIEQGKSFDEMVATTVAPPAWQESALARAAFVRIFDDKRFHKLLAPDAPGADFTQFIAIPGIEPARAYPEQTYRLKETVAVEYLQAWLTKQGVEEIRKFSGRVLAELGDTNADEMERLRFLIPVRPDEALKLFDRLFDEADRAFDLARCQELIELLRELDNFEAGGRSVPLRLLSEELGNRRDTLGLYVAARGRFIEDYSKSANYLQRDELIEPTTSLLDQSQRWLLSIYGRGGIGKSMFLRWFIARQALPKPRCIPVARIDFDEIDIGKLADFPSLMLVQFAEQLNRQIAESPFKEYLQDFARFCVLLLPPARLPKGVNVEGLEKDFRSDPALNARLTESFAAKLSKPVILILDTLEEGVLHFPDALRAALGCLRSVHAQTQYLNVILAGRYDLKERGYLTDDDPAPIELKPLSGEESTRLLGEIIQLKASDKLIAATVRKAKGNPFILSLIAQLIKDGEVTSVSDVDKLEPEFAYLVKRIIERIPDSQRAVRWVIRYGVVPRRLTPVFLGEVMQPHLRRELAAAEEAHRDAVKKFSESFPRGAAFDVEAVWRDLRQYADPCGWLRASEDELRFQPEVVRPMRALLRNEKIYNDLHASAVDCYEAHAENAKNAKSTDDFVRATGEALYHRFAKGDPSAEQRWQSALDDTTAQTIARRRILLEVVTDLIDFEALDEGKALALPVSNAVLAHALRELAKVRAGIGFGPVPAPDRPAEIADLLKLAARFSPETRPDEPLVGLALAVASRDYKQALEISANATISDSPAEQYAFEILVARSLAAMGHGNAYQHYARACVLLERNGETYPSSRIWAECGRAHARAGEWYRAMDAYGRARKGTTDRGDDYVLGTDIAELLIDSGEYAAASASVSVGSPEDLRDAAVRTRERFRRDRVNALCAIAHGRPDLAAPIVSRGVPDPDSPLQQAQFRELQAELAAAHFNPRTAFRLFDQAAKDYAQAQFETEANKALLKALRTAKDQIGDWRLAITIVTRLSSASMPPSVTVEAAHLTSLTDVEGKTGVLLDTPAVRLIRHEGAEQHVGEFFASLADTEPSAARYEQLNVFAWLKAGRYLKDLRPLFMEVVPPPEPSDPDFFPRSFGSIEMLRCLGRPEARDLLQSAIERDDNIYVLHRLIDAAGRLGVALPSFEKLQQVQEASGANGFGFATLVKYRRALLDLGDTHAAARVFATIPEIPEELRGTGIEAMHLVDTSRLPDVSKKGKRAAVHRAADIMRLLGQEKPLKQLLGGRYSTSERSKRPRATVELREISMPWPIFSTREIVPYELAKMLASAPGVAPVELQRSLVEWELPHHIGVELSIDDAPTAMLPWEWALADHEICFRSSARIPSDEYRVPRRFAGKLPQRMRQFLAFFRPLRVTILRPPISSQESIGRGFELKSRRTLVEIYATHGVRAAEPNLLADDHMRQVFKEHDPDVVHIQAPIIERNRDLVVDLPLGSGPLTVEYLIDHFKRGSDPMVILDPPRPLDDAETARQLLLRNRFAAELIATGRVRAVLGAGLLPVEQLQFATERLTTCLGGFPLLRELLDLFHRELSLERFSGIGAALFTADPDEILP